MADEASAGNGEIGSVEQALTSVAAASSTYNLPSGRYHHATCKIQDKNGLEHIAVFGGFNSAGNPLSEILVGRPGAAAWSTVTSDGVTVQSLSVARGQLQAITDPADPKTCWIVGGAASENGNAIASNGSTSFTVEKFTADAVTAGRWALTHATGGTNFAQIAVTRHVLSSCPSTNKIVAFAGVNNSGTQLADVQMFDRSTPTTAWANPVDLGASRVNFGFVRDVSGGETRFVITGGDSSGSDSNRIDLISTENSCADWGVTSLSGANGLADAVVGNATLKIDADTYISTVGKVAGSAVTATEELAVTWNSLPTLPVLASLSAGTAAPTATFLPMVLQDGAIGYVVGGMDSSNDTFFDDAAMDTYWGTPRDLLSNTAGNRGRKFGKLEKFGSLVYVIGGIEDPASLSATFPVTLFEITP